MWRQRNSFRLHVEVEKQGASVGFGWFFFQRQWDEDEEEEDDYTLESTGLLSTLLMCVGAQRTHLINAAVPPQVVTSTPRFSLLSFLTTPVKSIATSISDPS